MNRSNALRVARMIGVAALLGLVQTPVLPVQIEMVIAAAGVGHAHVPLRIARERFTDEGLFSAVLEGPGVVLRSAEIHLLELGHAFVIKEREAQSAFAVIGAKEEAEGVFRVTHAAAVSASDAQTGVDMELKVGAANGVDQLDGDRALPGDAVVAGLIDDVPEVAGERVDDDGARRQTGLHRGQGGPQHAASHLRADRYRGYDRALCVDGDFTFDGAISGSIGSLERVRPGNIGPIETAYKT